MACSVLTLRTCQIKSLAFTFAGAIHVLVCPTTRRGTRRTRDRLYQISHSSTRSHGQSQGRARRQCRIPFLSRQGRFVDAVLYSLLGRDSSADCLFSSSYISSCGSPLYAVVGLAVDSFFGRLHPAINDQTS